MVLFLLHATMRSVYSILFYSALSCYSHDMPPHASTFSQIWSLRNSSKIIGTSSRLHGTRVIANTRCQRILSEKQNIMLSVVTMDNAYPLKNDLILLERMHFRLLKCTLHFPSRYSNRDLRVFSRSSRTSNSSSILWDVVTILREGGSLTFSRTSLGAKTDNEERRNQRLSMTIRQARP